MSRAACRGKNPDLFFPRKGQHPDRAKAICLTCTVQGPCSDYADGTATEYGVWAGSLRTPRIKFIPCLLPVGLLEWDEPEYLPAGFLAWADVLSGPTLPEGFVLWDDAPKENYAPEVAQPYEYQVLRGMPGTLGSRELGEGLIATG